MKRLVFCALTTISLLAPRLAAGQLALVEEFAYAAGPLDGRGEKEINGWADAWEGEGLVVRDGVGTGQGRASRRTIPRIDFELDDEWFIRVRIQRWGVTGASDYAVLKLLNNDRLVDRAPLFVGINSAERFYGGAGVASDGACLFGEPTPDQAYVLVAHLRTRFAGQDALEVWAFPADQPLPASLPRPHMEQRFEYSGHGDTIELRTGSADGYRASFDDLIVGSSWEDIRAAEYEPFRFKHPYRRLRPVRVADDGVHMLPNLWGNMSVIPWDDDHPQLIHTSTLPWLPTSSRIYTMVTDARAAGARPKANLQVPLFDGGRRFDDLPHGRYQPVSRPDRGFDLVDLDDMTYLPVTGEPGKRRVEAGYELLNEPLGGGNRHTFLSDVDGDGVVDLLVGRLRESKWNYWPEGGSPWRRPRQRLMGPDRDAAVNENLRGYDVAGNWLGSRLTYELVWAKGERGAGRLRFGELKPVYYGRDDFPLQWRNYSQVLAAGAIERGGQTYIVMLSSIDQVLAAPVLETDDGELHTGEVIELLAPDERRYSLNMDRIHGIMDLDGDGVTEIIVGSGSSGHVTVLKGHEIGRFRAHVVQMAGGPLAVATLAVPTFGDWDGDGRGDLIVGDSQGLFTLFPGTDDPLVFAGSSLLRDSQGRIIKHSGRPNIQGPQERAWGYTQAQMFDWDADGQLDLITNDNTATFKLFRRIDPADPARVDDTATFTMDGAKLPVAWRSRPTAVPGQHRVAGDDRPVLIYQDVDQLLTLGIPQSIGSTVIERVIHLTYVDGEPIPLSWWGGLSGRTSFSVDDWDEDGRWDVVLSAQPDNANVFYKNPKEMRLSAYVGSWSPFWLRNVGTNAEPVFERARRIRYADGSIIRVETHAGNVCLADLDGDGKALDLFYGDGPGFVYYLMRDELTWDEEPGDVIR